ncbi:MAG: helix-turn-helix domain-containing protein [Prolixibacteraceae bacterium]
MHFDSIISLIKERRQQMNVSQEMLSDISGVALRTIKLFEVGKGNPTLSTLMKITDALGLEIVLQAKHLTDV